MAQHAITGLLGADIDAAHTSQVFARGTRVCAVDDTTSGYAADYIYTSADVALAQFSACKIDDDYDSQELTTAISGVQPTRVGAPQIALADTELGWLAVCGSFSILCAANCAADVKLYTTATAGVVDDTATDLIGGLKIDTLIGGAQATGSAFATQDMVTNHQD